MVKPLLQGHVLCPHTHRSWGKSFKFCLGMTYNSVRTCMPKPGEGWPTNLRFQGQAINHGLPGVSSRFTKGRWTNPPCSMNHPSPLSPWEQTLAISRCTRKGGGKGGKTPSEKITGHSSRPLKKNWNVAEIIRFQRSKKCALGADAWNFKNRILLMEEKMKNYAETQSKPAPILPKTLGSQNRTIKHGASTPLRTNNWLGGSRAIDQIWLTKSSLPRME